MKIYHLSHTDLDGYACQFIVNFYFKNVKFYNSNYGKEINENFNSIIGDIEKDENFGKAIILITDLNLNLNQCEEFEKICKEKNTKIFFLIIIKVAKNVLKNILGIYLILKDVQLKSFMIFSLKSVLLF